MENRYTFRFGEVVLEVDTSRGQAAVARLPDVSIVNATTAPQLLDLFGEAWEWTANRVTDARAAKDRVEEQLEVYKAEALLKAADDPKRGKSQDLRTAAVKVDPEVRKAADALIEISALKSYLETATERFEKAWRSVRAVSYSAPPPKSDLHGAPGGLGNAGGDKDEDEFSVNFQFGRR